MVVNDDEVCLTRRGALRFFASSGAPPELLLQERYSPFHKTFVDKNKNIICFICIQKHNSLRASS